MVASNPVWDEMRVFPDPQQFLTCSLIGKHKVSFLSALILKKRIFNTVLQWSISLNQVTALEILELLLILHSLNVFCFLLWFILQFRLEEETDNNFLSQFKGRHEWRGIWDVTKWEPRTSATADTGVKGHSRKSQVLLCQNRNLLLTSSLFTCNPSTRRICC